MKRIILLTVLCLEGVGGILGGLLLVKAPDGHLMDIPVSVMHGTFPDFLIPGIILTGLGVLALTAFVTVLLKARFAWIMAMLSLIGYVIWFIVEIVILQEVHILQVIWGLPVLVGLWAAIPLIPVNKHETLE